MELTTSRLLLRPLRDDDARAIALGANNLNVSRNLTRVKFPYAVADAHEFLASAAHWDVRSRVRAIAFKCAPDELIGIIAYEVTASGQYEFGYWLNESCWGMRIATEAANAMVHNAFAVDAVGALNSGYHTDNPNSGRILRRLGFVETGVVHEECLAQGTPVPCMRLALTRENWLAQKESRAA
jgi:RimJ/RimL family protein N-acetyltransferase